MASLTVFVCLPRTISSLSPDGGTHDTCPYTVCLFSMQLFSPLVLGNIVACVLKCIHIPWHMDLCWAPRQGPWLPWGLHRVIAERADPLTWPDTGTWAAGVQWLTTSTDYIYSRGPCGWNQKSSGPQLAPGRCLLFHLDRENPLKQLLGSTSLPSSGQKFLSWTCSLLRWGITFSGGSEAPSCISFPGKQSSFSLVKMEEEHCPANEERMTWCPQHQADTVSRCLLSWIWLPRMCLQSCF